MDSRQSPEELFHLILEHREAILSVVRWSDEEQKHTAQPRFKYDNSDPIIKDSRLVASECGLERSSNNSLTLEWSNTRQELFEECVGNELLQSERLRQVIKEFGAHWKNAAISFPVSSKIKALSPVSFLEPYEPGITFRLHELGKTREFAKMQNVETNYNLVFEAKLDPAGKVQIETPTHPFSIISEYPIYEGDELIQRYGRTVRSENRAFSLANRGMTEYVGRLGLVEDFKQINCALCTEDFWPQAIWPSDVIKTGSPRYCENCLGLKSDVWRKIPLDIVQRRELAIRGIELAASLTGLFPFKDLKRQTIGHMEPEMRDKWFMAQVFMPDRSAKDLFGSWDEMLSLSDSIGIRPRKGRGGYVTTSSCGHVCYSLGERKVCDRLDELGIQHLKEPLYPVHSELNPNGLLRGDWVVGEVWIELAGYPDDPKYMKKMANKQELAHMMGLSLLVLMPSDLRALDLAFESFGIVESSAH